MRLKPHRKTIFDGERVLGLWLIADLFWFIGRAVASWYDKVSRQQTDTDSVNESKT